VLWKQAINEPHVAKLISATKIMIPNMDVTVSCGQGDTSLIYGGLLNFEKTPQDFGGLTEVGSKIMTNVGHSESTFTFGQLPNARSMISR